MKFFLKCILLFTGLVIILLITDQLLLGSEHPAGASLLYSIMISLVATLIYGWIEEVYLNPRSE